MPIPFFKPNGDEELNLDLTGSSGLLVITTDNGNYHIDKNHILFRIDNTVDLGGSSYRFKNIYAASGTVNSSDARQKSDIAVLPDAVLDAWEDVQWCQFKFNDAIKEKGEEVARFHAGLVAQRILEVFESHGLDACQYGLICHGVWEAEPAKMNEDGSVLEPAVSAGDCWMLRYDECLAVEAAYQRRRIAALEARLNEISGSSPAPSGASTNNI